MNAKDNNFYDGQLQLHHWKTRQNLQYKSNHAVGHCRRSTNRQEQFIPDQNNVMEYITDHNLRLVSKGFWNNISLVLCYQGLSILTGNLTNCRFLLLFAIQFVKVPIT